MARQKRRPLSRVRSQAAAEQHIAGCFIFAGAVVCWAFIIFAAVQ